MADRTGLVEFVGLPASGKTHLAKEVKARLATEVDTISTASEKRTRHWRGMVPGLILWSLVCAPGHGGKSAVDLYRTDQRPRQLLTYWLYQLYLHAEWRSAGSGELHLSDQGFIQHVWRVRLTAGSMDVDGIKRFLSQHPPRIPDVVVFVDVDHQTRMKRGRDRGTSVRDAHFDPEHPAIVRDRMAFRDVRTAVDELIDEHEDGPLTLRIENTEAELDENVDRVIAAIKA